MDPFTGFPLVSTTHLPPSLLASLIIRGRLTSRQLFGKKPDFIITPYTQDQTNWLLQTSDDWVIVLSSFTGNLDNHYPSDPLIQFAKIHHFIFPTLTKTNPIPKAALVFTDGSSNGTAAYIINNQVFTIKSPYSSAQLVELFAVLQVFLSLTNQPFNLYTDSAYIAQSIPLLETVPTIKPTTNATPLFMQLQTFILQSHHHPLLQRTSVQEALILTREIKTVARELADLTMSTPAELLAFPVTRSQNQSNPPPNNTRPDSQTSHQDAARIALPDSDEENETESSESDEEGNSGPDPPYSHSYKRLSLKTLEKIKTAVTNYGPTAPFTMALIENLSERWLTPNDWFFVAQAALSGGDFILWKSDYEETSKQFAERNARKSSSNNWTLKKISGH